MTGSPASEAVAGLARFVRADAGAILIAWQSRLATLPASGPSLAARGEGVLAWLASSLEARACGDEPAQEIPSENDFSAARAIAELALLAETISELQPRPATDAARDALHVVVDRAIAYSLSRDLDDRERLRKRLRLATHVTLVGAWEIEKHGGAVHADARARELFGMTESEPATFEAITAHFDPHDRARVRASIAQALDLGHPFIEECQTLRPDVGGPRWVVISGDLHPGAPAMSRRLLGIIHDITDRKRTELAHGRVVDELSRAIHVSEMFIGILSHDLRNPLSAVLAGAQVLRLQPLDERAGRIVDRVVSSGERMARMIDQLLDFTRSRIGQGIPLRRDVVALALLAQEAIDEGKATSPACDLRLSVAGDTSGAWDRDRVSQVLSNLVGNALQHGDATCPIRIVLEGSDPEHVVLSIENTGVVPDDLIAVLFNPFRGTMQKRGKSKGLGLGLYVARQIALAHGGDLEVQCSATTTAFWLRLPRAARDVPAAPRDSVSDLEVAAFERMAAPLSTSAVTAQMFGARALRERAPLEHKDIVARYRELLDTALHRKAYRGHGEGIADDLSGLAERLGDLGAGPREVNEVHTEALKHAMLGMPAARTAALLSEGRLLALELMGNLASYYRRRARGYVRADRPEVPTP